MHLNRHNSHRAPPLTHVLAVLQVCQRPSYIEEDVLGQAGLPASKAEDPPAEAERPTRTSATVIRVLIRSIASILGIDQVQLLLPRDPADLIAIRNRDARPVRTSSSSQPSKLVAMTATSDAGPEYYPGMGTIEPLFPASEFRPKSHTVAEYAAFESAFARTRLSQC
jgi:hypothetical protein